MTSLVYTRNAYWELVPTLKLLPVKAVAFTVLFVTIPPGEVVVTTSVKSETPNFPLDVWNKIFPMETSKPWDGSCHEGLPTMVVFGALPIFTPPSGWIKTCALETFMDKSVAHAIAVCLIMLFIFLFFTCS